MGVDGEPEMRCVKMAVSPSTVVLQVEVPGFLEETVSNIIAFLPRLVGALVILLIGWILGVVLGKIVKRLVDRVELDKFVLDTPLGGMMGGSQDAVSATFGKITKWFVYALAILTAADVLAIELLSEWVQTAVSYLPAFIAGLFVIVLGFVVADFIGDAIMQTRAATQTAYTQWFSTGTRMFLYFTAIVIGLDTMGIDVSILYLFARAIAFGLAAALAIGLGIAIGWGGHSYVSDNIDRWLGQASSSTPSPGDSRQTDGSGSTDTGTPED